MKTLAACPLWAKTCAALMLALLLWFAPAHAQSTPAPTGGRYVAGQLLVQFRTGTTEREQQAARATVAAVAVERIRSAGRASGKLELAALRGKLSVDAAVRALRKHPAVAFAEPNWIYTHTAVANDPYYTNGSLWGMYGDATSPANAFGSRAGEAWAAGHTGSRSVVVGVIDEGIDYNHPDLTANIGNPNEVPGDGIDNDGNGFVDDTYGRDFVNNDNTIYDGGNQDKHGTHVSGTIGAVGGNGIGVAGVNWAVSIISGKFLGRNGGTTANAVKAVDYFTTLKTQSGLNVVATNNSWGGGGYSQALHDAIIRGAKAGILFVAAAGNDGTDNDSTIRYPSSYDTTKGTSTQSAAGFDAVIAVASITNTGARSSFSNYGATTVDLGAPGSTIYSTLPGSTYGAYSGTSMATPHVSGAIALYAAANPGVEAAQIRTAVLTSVAATSSLQGKTVTGGRLNVGALLGSSQPVATPTPGPTEPPAATGAISGTVQNSTGDAIGGATIVVAQTTLTATSDENGSYTISAVPVGTYTMSASAAGYVTGQQTAVEVTADATTNVGFVLEATPPPVGALQVTATTSTSLGTPSSTFAIGDLVMINVVVSDGTNPVAGAAVSVNLTTPRGKQYVANGTTDANGLATFSFTPHKKDGSGTYQYRASATKTDYTGGTSDTGTFTAG